MSGQGFCVRGISVHLWTHLDVLANERNSNRICLMSGDEKVTPAAQEVRSIPGLGKALSPSLLLFSPPPFSPLIPFLSPPFPPLPPSSHIQAFLVL